LGDRTSHQTLTHGVLVLPGESEKNVLVACSDFEIETANIAAIDRPQGLGEKAKAGFHLFARQQDHAKLRRVLDTQEISARIFAL
jgi:hypothetical protein